jgi:hypothetical protein
MTSDPPHKDAEPQDSVSTAAEGEAKKEPLPPEPQPVENEPAKDVAEKEPAEDEPVVAEPVAARTVDVAPELPIVAALKPIEEPRGWWFLALAAAFPIVAFFLLPPLTKSGLWDPY